MQTRSMKLPKYAEKKFAHYLREMERSDATVEKYLHDLRCFISFVNKDTCHAPKSVPYRKPKQKRNANRPQKLKSHLDFVQTSESICRHGIYRPETETLDRSFDPRFERESDFCSEVTLKHLSDNICGDNNRRSETDDSKRSSVFCFEHRSPKQQKPSGDSKLFGEQQPHMLEWSENRYDDLTSVDHAEKIRSSFADTSSKCRANNICHDGTYRPQTDYSKRPSDSCFDCEPDFCSEVTLKHRPDTIITKQTVLSYKAYLAENYAVTSANSMIAALNCFFRFCGRDDMCVKQYRVQRKIYCSEEKELSKTEYLCLLKAAKDQENEQIGLIVQTICGTGIRVSELKYITVEAAENEEAVVRCKGKNRRVFIVPELKKKLLRYSKKHGIRSGTIFKTKHGKDISRNSVWKAMKKLCKKANVAPSKVFPHNLRHLFARTFYGIEKDIAKLSDILGHASIDTTRIYIITTGAEHRRKMENMRLVL